MNIIYIKTKGMRTFKAFDITNGAIVNNVVYASVIDDNKKNRALLQEMSDSRKDINVVFQLRYNVSVSAFTYCHKKTEQGILAQLCYSFVEGCQRSGNRFL